MKGISKLPASNSLKEKNNQKELASFVNHHEYDFGSTTVLGLKVVSEFEASIKDKQIRIVTRNDAPEIKCEECEKLATIKIKNSTSLLKVEALRRT